MFQKKKEKKGKISLSNLPPKNTIIFYSIFNNYSNVIILNICKKKKKTSKLWLINNAMLDQLHPLSRLSRRSTRQNTSRLIVLHKCLETLCSCGLSNRWGFRLFNFRSWTSQLRVIINRNEYFPRSTARLDTHRVAIHDPR